VNVQIRSKSHRRRLGVVAVTVSGLDFSQGEIGDVGTTTVEVQFTLNVNATDYKAGVTIKLNAVGQTINTATRQADHKFVYYVIAAAADVNDVLTWEYDDDLGDYEDDGGDPMGDIGATGLTNYIGAHLYFDTADDSPWTGAL